MYQRNDSVNYIMMGSKRQRGKKKRADLRPWMLSNYHALYITSVLNVQMDKSLKQCFMVSGTRKELYMGITTNGYRVFIQSNKKYLMDSSVGAQHCRHTSALNWNWTKKILWWVNYTSIKLI